MNTWVLCTVTFVTGYLAGRTLELGGDAFLEQVLAHLQSRWQKRPRQQSDRLGSDDESEEESDVNGYKPNEEYKMVLVVRSDLGMGKGKIAAQCAHATLANYRTMQELQHDRLLRHWELHGQTKVAVRCDSEEEMLELQAKAKSLRICANSIKDAGRTQVAPNSRTVLAVGPAPKSEVDRITGHLKLLG